MIRPAHILPIGRLIRYTDMHMALTHLVESAGSRYNEFFKELPDSDYIILDNSVIELGEPVNLDRLLKAADTINADEIVIPDSYKNKEETIRLMYYYLDRLVNKNVPYKIQVVPHGDNIQEWVKCYKEISSVNEVDVIGVPKVTSSLMGGEYGRVSLLKVINMFKGNQIKKPHHLLGIWNNPSALSTISHLNWIRSVDSAVAYATGVNGIKYDKYNGANRPEDLEWSFYDNTDNNEEVIRHNIECINRWCKYE